MFSLHTHKTPDSPRRAHWHRASAIGTTLFLVFMLAACGGSSTNTATPTASALQYTTIPLNLPAAAYKAQLLGQLPAATPLQLGVSFKVNASVLAKAQGQVPTGQKVDVSKIANEYGISDATFQQIKAYLGIEDVSLKLGKLHSYMAVTAKAASVAKLFQTQFQLYKLNGRQYYVPAANEPPKLPSFIMNYVVAITGLESYFTLTPGFRAPPMTARPLSSKHQAADCTVTAPNTLLPQQIAAAYGYGQFTRHGFNGAGVTINLVELGGIAGDDLSNYFACVNYPTSQFSYKDIIQPSSDPDPDGTAEATLDIEMIAGLATGANIIDYEAAIANPKDTGMSLSSQFELLNDGLQSIIDDNVSGSNNVNLVSLSYGAPESDLDPNVVNAIDQSLNTLDTAENMSIFVSSGDCGAFGTHELDKLGVSFPSTDPWVTAVGGTRLAVNSQGNRAGEIVWSKSPSSQTCTDNSWGSGGGVSQDFKMPSWQAGAGVSNRYSDGARQVPDIAAAAINIPIYFAGQWQAVGGTSAAAPIWASSMAVLDQALLTNTKHFVYGPDLFYIVANKAAAYHPFFDVTGGNNLYYTATTNWDDATGWGSPNLLNLYNAIVALLK